MTFKTICAAAALSLLPAVSFAFCSYGQQQAQSCAAGFVWDSETHACVEQISS